MDSFIKEYQDGMITVKEYGRLYDAETELIRLASERKYSFFLLESVNNDYTETGNLDHYKLSFY
jgi:hypothetical protein